MLCCYVGKLRVKGREGEGVASAASGWFVFGFEGGFLAV
jgi:hypothetical protein